MNDQTLSRRAFFRGVVARSATITASVASIGLGAEIARECITMDQRRSGRAGPVRVSGHPDSPWYDSWVSANARIYLDGVPLDRVVEAQEGEAGQPGWVHMYVNYQDAEEANRELHTFKRVLDQDCFAPVIERTGRVEIRMESPPPIVRKPIVYGRETVVVSEGPVESIDALDDVLGLE